MATIARSLVSGGRNCRRRSERCCRFILMVDCFVAVVISLLRVPSAGVSWPTSDLAAALETADQTVVGSNNKDTETAKSAFNLAGDELHRSSLANHNAEGIGALKQPSAIVNNGEGTVSPSKVLLLHYHKTGHELSRILAVIGFQQNRFQKLKRSFKAEDVVVTLNTPTPLIVGSALALHQFEPNQLDALHIIHFVRDPYDWVRSAYQYHSQKPVPVLERGWLDKTRKSPPCTMPSHLRGFAMAELGITFEEQTEIEDLCHDLRVSTKEATHYRVLQALSIDDGMRMEAARGLLGIRDHGDLMCMAYNLHILADHRNVETVFLKQLTGSKETFDQTAGSICSSGRAILLLPSDRSVQDCATSFREKGFLGENNVTTMDPLHVTSSKWTTEEKKQRLQSLLSDPVIGGPLRRVYDYMMRFKHDD